MRGPKPKTKIFVLLLVVAFLGTQFHFCSELVATPDSHVCPVCSAADSVAPAAPIIFAGLVDVQRMEQQSTHTSIPFALSLVLSLRAPPAL